MRLNNCTASQDAILTECESFGGKAEEAAEIANEIDTKLTEALDNIETLKQELQEKDAKIDTLQFRIDHPDE